MLTPQLYFTLVYSQIWLNRSRDDRHFRCVKDFLEKPYFGVQIACWFHQTNNNNSNNRILSVGMPKRNSKFQPFNNGGWGRCKMVFFKKKTGPKSPHHEKNKNLKPPHMWTIGSKTMISTHFVMGIPKFPFSLFHLLPNLAKPSCGESPKLTASQISNTEPLHSA